MVVALRTLLSSSKQPSWSHFITTNVLSRVGTSKGARKLDRQASVVKKIRTSLGKNPKALYQRAQAEQSSKKKVVPETKSSIRLLRAPILSARLKKLCDNGQVDVAVSTLKNAPLDAQNTPVWNTLIWECMKAERFKLAYELFIDVSIQP
jgi:hypothetical protein